MSNRKVREVERVKQSFSVLVHEILLHEHALVGRCVIMRKFDTTHASARSNSLLKTVDVSKHRPCSISQ